MRSDAVRSAWPGLGLLLLASTGCDLSESAELDGGLFPRVKLIWNGPDGGLFKPRVPLAPIPDAGASDAGTTPAPAADGGVTRPPRESDAGVTPEDSGTDTGTDAGSVTPPPPPARLVAYGVPSDGASEPMPSDFSVSETRELYIYSVHSGLVGEHRELRRFYAPSGDLYYEKLLAYSTDLDEPIPFMDERVTIPRSKQVAAVKPDENGRLVISDVFPVAGTWISDRAMTGTWNVEMYLDGAKQASSTLQLELVP